MDVEFMYILMMINKITPIVVLDYLLKSLNQTIKNHPMFLGLRIRECFFKTFFLQANGPLPP